MCRQVKEREVEDHMFGDKEKFVTAAYKKKLQERQLWEAEQKLKCVAAGRCMRSCDSGCVGRDFERVSPT